MRIPRQELNLVRDDKLRAMYQKALAGWAMDLLTLSAPLTWPARDPVADYRDRDWRRLYTGSILDD